MMASSSYGLQYRDVAFSRQTTTPTAAVHCRRRTLRMIAVAVVVSMIATAAVRMTDAAPQDIEIITIDGQSCKCVQFYMCLAENTITPTDQSPGCSDGLTCCRTDEPSGPDTTTTSTTTTESTDVSNQECTCVREDECVTFDKNLKPTNAIIGEKSCSQNKVCCLNDYIVLTDNSKPIFVPVTKENVTDRSCGIGMPNSQYYDDNIGTRIVASDNTKTYFGQFPWMVAILKKEIDETGVVTDNVFQCGGSLIRPRVVLTAAHCVRGLDLDILKVRVGEWDTQANDKDEKNTHYDIPVSEVYIHENHNNGSMFNDIALIELDSKILLYTSKPYINTICLPNNGKQINYDPQSCVSTGWGKNGFDKGSRYENVLKKIDLSLVPNDVCQQQLRNTRLGNFFRLHETFICAGGVKGVDVCKGDGGGPLICAIKGEKSGVKKYVQVGIVSWGIGCGEEKVPGVYSSVLANFQWLEKQLHKITQKNY